MKQLHEKWQHTVGPHFGTHSRCLGHEDQLAGNLRRGGHSPDVGEGAFLRCTVHRLVITVIDVVAGVAAVGALCHLTIAIMLKIVIGATRATGHFVVRMSCAVVVLHCDRENGRGREIS